MAPLSPAAFYLHRTNPQSLNYHQLSKIKRELGISVRNDALLITALTHSSYLNEPEGADAKSNESLATIGDAALQLAITTSLYEIDASLDKGQITLIRSRVVENKTLARIARNLGIGEYLALRMGKGERQRGGANVNSNLACAFEAIVGAIFIGNPPFGWDRSQGYAAAAKFCGRVLQDEISDAYHAVIAAPPKPKAKQNRGNNKPKQQSKTKNAAKNQTAKNQPVKKQSAKTQSAKKQSAKSAGPNTAGKHPKSALQEITQAKYGVLPEYRVTKSTGKSNNPTFSVNVSFNGKTLGKGSGSGKKAAETEAATQALRALGAL